VATQQAGQQQGWARANATVPLHSAQPPPSVVSGRPQRPAAVASVARVSAAAAAAAYTDDDDDDDGVWGSDEVVLNSGSVRAAVASAMPRAHSSMRATSSPAASHRHSYTAHAAVVHGSTTTRAGMPLQHGRVYATHGSSAAAAHVSPKAATTGTATAGASAASGAGGVAAFQVRHSGTLVGVRSTSSSEQPMVERAPRPVPALVQQYHSLPAIPAESTSAVVCGVCRKWFGNDSALRAHYKTDEHVAVVDALADTLDEIDPQVSVFAAPSLSSFARTPCQVVVFSQPQSQHQQA
jgi:hypothetical protein